MQPRSEHQFLTDIGEAVDRIETYTAEGEAAFHASESADELNVGPDVVVAVVKLH